MCLIFLIKIALIVLQVSVALQFEVSSLTKSNCSDFTAKDEWPQILPTSIHITFGSNAGHVATEAKYNSQV